MQQKIPAVLHHKREIKEGVFEYTFVTSQQFIPFRPGQYMWLQIPLIAVDVHGDRRAFSLVSSPQSQTYSILFRKSDSGYKQSLIRCEVGQQVNLYGPHGSLLDLPDDTPKVFLGAGVGIAPIMSALRAGVHRSPLTVIAINSDEPIYADELQKMHHSLVHIHYATRASLHNDMKTYLQKDARYVIIGPQDFCTETAHFLSENSVDAHMQHFEEFYPDDAQTKSIGTGEQEIFMKAVMSSSQHIIITDHRGMVVFANPASERMTGYSRDEMYGHTPRLWGGVMNDDFYKKLWQQILIEKKPFVGEITNVRKDGMLYEVIAHISPIVDRGVVTGFVGTEEDITRIKYTEQKLREQTQLLHQHNMRVEAILASIGDAVIVTDPSLRITHVNQSAERLLGYTAAELIGGLYHQIVRAVQLTGELVHDTDRTIYKVLQTKKPLSEEAIYLTKDGHKFAAAVTCAPIQESTQVTGVVQVIRDVSREKEIDRMKTEFISLASHQLRTPLSAMRWYSEMLLAGDAGKLTEQQLSFVTHISDSSDRMIALVNALLNISRIESGRIVIDAKPTELREFVAGVVAELSPRAQAKNQQIITNIHSRLPPVALDKKLVREVFVNLITNAIKYTPDGGEILIFISKKGDKVMVQVSDTGYGIPPGEKSKVFEKFYRGSNITKIETDGTGLGLYLVKAIVESSGGEISFRSDAQKGTTFWFTLPINGPKQ